MAKLLKIPLRTLCPPDIGSQTLLFLIVILTFILPGRNHAFSEEKLAVIIVMDASGSLKQTDPGGSRKIAAGIFINLLESRDLISIIEFDKDARVLLPLTKASEKKKAIEMIEKIGDTGEFTDFRKALEMALKELEKLKDDYLTPMVVFFTDGILEPDLTDSIYYPYNRDYPMEIRGAKQRSEREAIRKRYTELVTPKTERIIFEELLPKFKEKGAEIYSVALTDQANTKLLKDIVDKTTKHPEENHFFLAKSYRDLTKQFIKVLGCRRPIFVAFERDGVIKDHGKETIFIDPYIHHVNFSLIADHKGIDVQLSNPSGKIFSYSTDIGGVFYDYSDLPFESGKWEILLKGDGKYTLLAMAKSKIAIDVKGLKKIYKCKEPVKFAVKLASNGQVLSDKDFSLLDFSIRIRDPLGNSKESKAKKEKEEYRFVYNPDVQGDYHVSVELKAKDRQGRDILPRPSKEMNFFVEQEWMIFPKDIYFGSYYFVGKEIVKKVEIESCLQETIEIKAETTGLISSNRNFDKNQKTRIPEISFDKIILSPGIKKIVEVKLSLPKKVYRGDYKGELRFSSLKGDTREITFRLHLYTFWEILMRLLPFIALLFSIILGVFIYMWGYLGTPFGVLIPENNPTGDLLGSIKLSQLKQGLLSRYFNWRRNRIRIMKKGGEINLPALPPGMKIELIFYRFGKKVYIRNQSSLGSAPNISVKEPSLPSPFIRGPGQKLSLKHKSIISLGEYQFRFEQV